MHPLTADLYYDCGYAETGYNVNDEFCLVMGGGGYGQRKIRPPILVRDKKPEIWVPEDDVPPVVTREQMRAFFSAKFYKEALDIQEELARIQKQLSALSK